MASQWTRALVTGASSGIGAAIAEQLAADGTDLVLVARSRDVLAEMAERFRDQHRIEVEVLAADLADDAQLGRVADRLGDFGRPVELLVNNAGLGFHDPFDQLPLDVNLQMVDVNLRALVTLTHAAIPTMRSRGRGGILNLSSISAFVPAPWMAVYGASKAFVQSFSEALHHELLGTGIHVTALAPGVTHTGFQEAGDVDESRVPDLFWMDAEPTARAGLEGVARNRTTVLPGPNRGLSVAAGIVPNAALRRIVGGLLRRPADRSQA